MLCTIGSKPCAVEYLSRMRTVLHWQKDYHIQQRNQYFQLLSTAMADSDSNPPKKRKTNKQDEQPQPSKSATSTSTTDRVHGHKRCRATTMAAEGETEGDTNPAPAKRGRGARTMTKTHGEINDTISSWTKEDFQFCGLINLRTGAPVIDLYPVTPSTGGESCDDNDAAFVRDPSQHANETMVRPFVSFWQDTSLFSRWMRNRFHVPQNTSGCSKPLLTHTMYNGGVGYLDDLQPGVRTAFVNLYTLAIAKKHAQIYINEMATYVSRVFFDIDCKGPAMSVEAVSRIVRFIQQTLDDYMDFFRWDNDAQGRRRVGTAIVLATKQFQVDASDEWFQKTGQEKVWKCGFHVVFPYVYATEEQRRMITQNVATVLQETVDCSQFVENWTKMIDPKVINNLRMLGSRRKKPCPNGCKVPAAKKTGAKTAARKKEWSNVHMYTVEDPGAPGSDPITCKEGNIDTDAAFSPFASTDGDSLQTIWSSSSVPAPPSPTQEEAVVAESAFDTQVWSSHHPANNGVSTSTMRASDQELSQSQDRTKPLLQRTVCRLCRGKGECCEDRSYVPLLVLDGHGDRDPAFELHCLDLRNAVDLTMIRAPSLSYNPTTGRIEPRKDVDPTVLEEQLYGRSMNAWGNATDDPHKETSLWSIRASVTEAYQFLLRRRPLTSRDLDDMYKFTRLSVSPFLFGMCSSFSASGSASASSTATDESCHKVDNGRFEDIKIPQWHKWLSYAPCNPPADPSAFTFQDVDTNVYPEGILHQQQQQPQQSSSKPKIRMDEYDGSTTAEDYRQWKKLLLQKGRAKRAGKADNRDMDEPNKKKQIVSISNQDPEFYILQMIVQTYHPTYEGVRAQNIFMDDKGEYCVRVLGPGSDYCFNKSGKHSKNHVLFYVQVRDAHTSSPFVRVQQSCFNDDIPPGATKPCNKWRSFATILHNIPAEDMQVLLDQSTLMEEEKTAALAASNTSPTGTKTTPKKSFQKQRKEKVQSVDECIVPCPAVVHEVPFLPDATVKQHISTTEEQRKIGRAYARLRLLWQEFCKHHARFSTVPQKRTFVRKLIPLWWKSSDTPKGTKFRMNRRLREPDDVLGHIRTNFLDKALKNKTVAADYAQAVPLVKQEGDFKQYVILFCFWFPSKEQYCHLTGVRKNASMDAQMQVAIDADYEEALRTCIYSRNMSDGPHSTHKTKTKAAAATHTSTSTANTEYGDADTSSCPETLRSSVSGGEHNSSVEDV